MTQINSHRRTLKLSGMGAVEWNLVQDLLGRRGGRPIRFVCCVVLVCWEKSINHQAKQGGGGAAAGDDR